QTQEVSIMRTMQEWLWEPVMQGSGVPAMNLEKDEKAFIVTLAVPGYTAPDVTVNVDGNILTISAKGAKEEQDRSMYLRKEIVQEGFVYQVELPENVDVENISAHLQDGLLRIQVPMQPKKVQQIAIQTSGATHELTAPPQAE
ncbi:MAG: Hsp20/alpha crystallin family protein, partial [Firmicutes bacterium]|nr:Hsp20/alpha crystallin family protein [Bacillota bacterium]